jgi:hypothetical protein
MHGAGIRGINLGQFRKNVILWAALIAVMALNAVSFAFGRLLSLVDISFFAAVILVIKKQTLSAYIVAGVSAGLADLLTMPFFGVHFFSSLAGVASVQFMSVNLFRDNYAAKVFILAAGEAVVYAAEAVLVFIFYWGWKVYFIPWDVFLKILVTTLAGAGVIKLGEIWEQGAVRWFRMTLKKI